LREVVVEEDEEVLQVKLKYSWYLEIQVPVIQL
jgi:hypothetical protein